MASDQILSDRPDKYMCIRVHVVVVVVVAAALHVWCDVSLSLDDIYEL